MEEKFMRVLIMFDLPTKTKKDRKNYTIFRNNIMKQGFFMINFSVYVRICKGVSAANTVMKNVEAVVPPYGNVRALIITEKQFDNMKMLVGKPKDNEKANAPKQLSLF